MMENRKQGHKHQPNTYTSFVKLKACALHYVIVTKINKSNCRYHRANATKILQEFCKINPHKANIQPHYTTDKNQAESH